MKTTYLFKMSGAWSPLWNLSNKSWFKIKSKEPIMFLGIDLANPAPDFICMMDQIVGNLEKAVGFIPTINKKQMEIFNQSHHLDYIGYGSKHANSIIFSEYHDPENFDPNPDVVSDVIDRAEELFGTDHVGFENRRIFINAALSGIPFVVLNKGNGNFEFRS